MVKYLIGMFLLSLGGCNYIEQPKGFYIIDSCVSKKQMSYTTFRGYTRVRIITYCDSTVKVKQYN